MNQQNDFEPFKHLLEAIQNTLGGGPDFADAKVLENYWFALKDLSLQTVERTAAVHMKYHKWFPKPVDLRPADDRQQPVATSYDEVQHAEKQHLAYCDAFRLRDPIGFAIWFNIEYCKRKMGEQVEHAITDWHDWRRDWFYWRDMQRRPLAEQRAALPTFAIEADMDAEERWDRQRLIRDSRSRGIRANQIAFQPPAWAKLPSAATGDLP